MMSVFGATNANNSFYKQEQKRILDLIQENMLKLVLERLPFLQPSAEAKDDAWEDVAMRIGVIYPEENLVLNGLFIRESYERLMADYRQRSWPGPGKHPDFYSPAKESCKSVSDRILWELFNIKDYDIELLATLAKERLEQQMRDAYSNSCSLVTSQTKHATRGSSTEEITEKDEKSGMRKTSDFEAKNSRIAYLEDEIAEKDSKLAQIVSENKKLLEFNHELVRQLNGLKQNVTS